MSHVTQGVSKVTLVGFPPNNNGSWETTAPKPSLRPHDYQSHGVYSSVSDQCIFSLIGALIRYQRNYLNIPLTQSISSFGVLRFSLVKLGQKIEQ